MRLPIYRCLVVLLICQPLSGCMEMVPGYRYKEWLAGAEKPVGHTYKLPINQTPSLSGQVDDIWLGDVLLPDGDRVVEFALTSSGACYYFYKYNPVSGKIIDFWFIKPLPNSCLSAI